MPVPSRLISTEISVSLVLRWIEAVRMGAAIAPSGGDATRLDPQTPCVHHRGMSESSPDSLIPYDEIVQEALRAVVGRVLGEVERNGGLPGDHHFYITFKTGAAGVDI